MVQVPPEGAVDKLLVCLEGTLLAKSRPSRRNRVLTAEAHLLIGPGSLPLPLERKEILVGGKSDP